MKSTNELLKELHFATEIETANQIKKQLKKKCGWWDADIDYNLKWYRKQIGEEALGTNLYPIDCAKADAEKRTQAAAQKEQEEKAAEKVKKDSQWNAAKYLKWIKSMASRDDSVNDYDYAYEMAQNAKHEPGLLAYVEMKIKRMWGDETPLERIQWDIEEALSR